jgi:Flp pilus assembly pilin Flp
MIWRKAGRRRLIADTAGVSTLEYGIVASLLALVLVSVFRGLGDVVSGLVNTITTLFSHAGGSV